MSNHSECDHAHFPICALNEIVGPYLDDPEGHGPAVGPFPLLNKVTGEARGLWLCRICWLNTQKTIDIPIVGPLLGTALAHEAKPWNDIEADVVTALGEHPGDPNLNSLLGAVRELREEIGTRQPVQIVMDGLNPMPVNDAAALFARTATNYPKREEIN